MKLFSKKNKVKQKSTSEQIREFLITQQCAYCNSKNLLFFQRWMVDNATFTDGYNSYQVLFCADCGKMQPVKLKPSKITEQSKGNVKN